MSIETGFGEKSSQVEALTVEQVAVSESGPAVASDARSSREAPAEGSSEKHYRRPILTLSSEELDQWLHSKGEPRFRLRQLLHWLYQQPVENFEQMSDIPKALRRELARAFRLWTTRVVEHVKADDGTEKLLVRLMDGETVECVLLRDDRGHRTACVSTQVGCAMGCKFCASGLGGFRRNLSAYEIVEQLLHLTRLLPQRERLTHIVVMGMGEPLTNLKNVLQALEAATSNNGLGISGRRVTISTVGIPPAIDRLAESRKPYHLAISLHAPNDELRTQIVPSNQKIGLKAILNAADRYFAKTGRRVTFEYVLLAGVNDRLEHAAALAELLKNRTALVNVIAYNPVPELPYQTPSPARVHRFVDKLREAGLNARVRFRKGLQIEAACGQLRRRVVAQTGSGNGGPIVGGEMSTSAPPAGPASPEASPPNQENKAAN